MNKSTKIIPAPLSKRLFVIAIILHLLLLSTFKDLFHNHKSEIECSSDCPVFVLEQILTSAIVVVSTLLLIRTFIIYNYRPKVTNYYYKPKLILLPRSPPIIYNY